MIQKEIEIAMHGRTADAFVYRPEGERQWPGVLHLTDIGGIRPAYHDMARKLAAEGYVVLMPNVFYRTSRPPVLERTPGDGEDVFRKRFAELTSPLTPEAIAGDAANYVDVLVRHDAVLPGSRFGVVGYCYTGAFALRVAAACPRRIAAATSFHGGSLVTDSSTSPHLLLPRIHAQALFRARRQRSQHAGGGHPHPRRRARKVGRQVPERDLRGRVSQLDGVRQPALQRSAGGTGILEADRVTRRDAALRWP